MTQQASTRNRIPALVDDAPDGEGRWLSIQEACVKLGVDQSTLRRWSDAGKVPVFRTPGGHRRYAESDLRTLVGANGRRPDRPRIRPEITGSSLSTFEEVFWQGARSRRWFRAFSPAKHDELRSPWAASLISPSALLPFQSHLTATHCWMRVVKLANNMASPALGLVSVLPKRLRLSCFSVPRSCVPW